MDREHRDYYNIGITLTEHVIHLPYVAFIDLLYKYPILILKICTTTGT